MILKVPKPLPGCSGGKVLASGITEKCEERDEQKRSAKQSGNMLMVLKKARDGPKNH